MRLPFRVETGRSSASLAFFDLVIKQLIIALLLPFQMLKKLDLDGMYKGQEDVNGEDYNVEEIDDERRPFRCHFVFFVGRKP